MELLAETHPEYLLLSISGDLRLWNQADRGAQFRERLEVILADEQLRQLVLNLKAVSQVDSLGIGALARVPMACLRRDIGIKIVLPAGACGESLRNVGIFWAWQVFEDEASAVRACVASRS